ncbi:MAG: class I SAM-dependent methyltransferase [Anaerolineae bacterium]|nr:class I SAM-dependent methyltransferase [Anaerolineae bacterium]
MSSVSEVKNLPSQLYSAFSPGPDLVVKFIYRLTQSYRLGKKVRLLDVGCGPGKMLPKYAQLGWQVDGLEIDPDFYAQAAHLAETLENVGVRLGGFHDIKQRSVYDLITAINGPFAYLLEREAQVDALERVYRALKPGGLFFLDIPNLLWFLKNDPEPPCAKKSVAGLRVQHQAQYEYDVHEATFTQRNEYIIEAPNGHATKLRKTDRHAIITYPDLVYLLEECGFIKLRSYNSYRSRRATPLKEKRIMIAAQKPVRQ